MIVKMLLVDFINKNLLNNLFADSLCYYASDKSGTSGITKEIYVSLHYTDRSTYLLFNYNKLEIYYLFIYIWGKSAYGNDTS